MPGDALRAALDSDDERIRRLVLQPRPTRSTLPGVPRSHTTYAAAARTDLAAMERPKTAHGRRPRPGAPPVPPRPSTAESAPRTSPSTTVSDTLDSVDWGAGGTGPTTAIAAPLRRTPSQEKVAAAWPEGGASEQQALARAAAVRAAVVTEARRAFAARQKRAAAAAGRAEALTRARRASQDLTEEDEANIEEAYNEEEEEEFQNFCAMYEQAFYDAYLADDLAPPDREHSASGSAAAGRWTADDEQVIARHLSAEEEEDFRRFVREADPEFYEQHVANAVGDAPPLVRVNTNEWAAAAAAADEAAGEWDDLDEEQMEAALDEIEEDRFREFVEAVEQDFNDQYIAGEDPDIAGDDGEASAGEDEAAAPSSDWTPGDEERIAEHFAAEEMKDRSKFYAEREESQAAKETVIAAAESGGEEAEWNHADEENVAEVLRRVASNDFHEFAKEKEGAVAEAYAQAASEDDESEDEWTAADEEGVREVLSRTEAEEFQRFVTEKEADVAEAFAQQAEVELDDAEIDRLATEESESSSGERDAEYTDEWTAADEARVAERFAREDAANREMRSASFERGAPQPGAAPRSDGDSDTDEEQALNWTAADEARVEQLLDRAEVEDRREFIEEQEHVVADVFAAQEAASDLAEDSDSAADSEVRRRMKHTAELARASQWSVMDEVNIEATLREIEAEDFRAFSLEATETVADKYAAPSPSAPEPSIPDSDSDDSAAQGPDWRADDEVHVNEILRQSSADSWSRFVEQHEGDNADAYLATDLVEDDAGLPSTPTTTIPGKAGGGASGDGDGGGGGEAGRSTAAAPMLPTKPFSSPSGSAGAGSPLPPQSPVRSPLPSSTLPGDRPGGLPERVDDAVLAAVKARDINRVRRLVELVEYPVSEAALDAARGAGLFAILEILEAAYVPTSSAAMRTANERAARFGIGVEPTEATPEWGGGAAGLPDPNDAVFKLDGGLHASKDVRKTPKSTRTREATRAGETVTRVHTSRPARLAAPADVAGDSLLNAVMEGDNDRAYHLVTVLDYPVSHHALQAARSGGDKRLIRLLESYYVEKLDPDDDEVADAEAVAPLETPDDVAADMMSLEPEEWRTPHRGGAVAIWGEAEVGPDATPEGTDEVPSWARGTSGTSVDADGWQVAAARRRLSGKSANIWE